MIEKTVGLDTKSSEIRLTGLHVKSPDSVSCFVSSFSGAAVLLLVCPDYKDNFFLLEGSSSPLFDAVVNLLTKPFEFNTPYRVEKFSLQEDVFCCCILMDFWIWGLIFLGKIE